MRRSLAIVAILVAACSPPPARAVEAAAAAGGFAVSYAAGARDAAGRFMGGTELRVLAAHGGRLYAGNGYWEDRPGPEGPQGATILVLDAPGAPWRVDHVFDARLPSGRPRDLAVSTLAEVTFATDGAGAPLSDPVSLLIATNWDLSGSARVFSRDDATGAWTAMTLAQDPPNPAFLPQVRSVGQHRDRVTGVDHVFAGQDPRGIFSGVYDPARPGRIDWSATPELALADVSPAGIAGRNGYVRVMSFAECNDRLYATVGQHIYERVDGATPHWRPVWTNPRPGFSETGLRGLTAIPAPAGAGAVLLVAVEGTAARLVRVDPRNGSAVSELELADFLGRRWGMPAGYAIAAYNDMARLRDPAGGEALLIGIETFIPQRGPIAGDHTVVDVGYGRLESGGWYLVRQPDAHYRLGQVGAPPGRALVSIRTIRVAPFPQEPDAIYFGGYDANKASAHDTAWIRRATTATALDAAR